MFAGVIGTSGSRKEYSVLGDNVNLAARLMQKACYEKEIGKKILICIQTATDSANKVNSYFYKFMEMKGKINPIAVFIPSLKNLPSSFDPFP